MIPKIIALCGLPASGKTTYCQTVFDRCKFVYVCPDEIRGELYGDPSIQGDGSEVFSIAYSRAREALKNGFDVVFDSTLISTYSRQRFLSEFRDLNIRRVIVVKTTPIKECLKRNRMRDRKVPEQVIRSMSRKYSVPKLEEGWDSVEFDIELG